LPFGGRHFLQGRRRVSREDIRQIEEVIVLECSNRCLDVSEAIDRALAYGSTPLDP
jgi:hypothetical protein